MHAADERISHIAKVAKLTQNYAEEETGKLRSQVQANQRMVETLHGSDEKSWNELRYIRERIGRIDEASRETENRLTAEVSSQNEKLYELIQQAQSDLSQAGLRIDKNESKISKLSKFEIDFKLNLATIEDQMEITLKKVRI